MKITNSQVYDIYKIMGCNYAAMARQLTETYGNFLGDTESIKAKARRAFQKRPHKKNLLSLWNQKLKRLNPLLLERHTHLILEALETRQEDRKCVCPRGQERELYKP